MVATASFERFGPEVPDSPVVLSVPHAGRLYPLPLRANLRVPPTALIALEDRYVDQVAIAARRGETMLVQQLARAWIDLNRTEDERDPLVEEDGGPPSGSARLRGGLGLVPRRTALAGDLWRRRFPREDVDQRIERDHRPYHAALAKLLRAARVRFGIAVLLDVHSMPTLPGRRSAEVVLGDRFGTTAGAMLIDAARDAVTAAGWRCALNAPYAGGHVVGRHGRPADHIHALQIEIDRGRYLDSRRDQPGAGLPQAAALLRHVIDAVHAAALGDDRAQAAE